MPLGHSAGLLMRLGRQKIPFLTRDCKLCGGDIYLYHFNQIFCGDFCKMTWHNVMKWQNRWPMHNIQLTMAIFGHGWVFVIVVRGSRPRPRTVRLGQAQPPLTFFSPIFSVAEARLDFFGVSLPSPPLRPLASLKTVPKETSGRGDPPWSVMRRSRI